MNFQQIIDFFNTELNGVLAIYIYGSYAKSQQTKDSDLDIGLYTIESISSIDIYNLKTNLEILVQKDIDLTFMNNASTVLKHQVVAYGKLLYKSNDFNQDNYENRIFQDYIDLREDIKPLLEEITQTGVIYG